MPAADEICMTGTSGRFPECENVDQFIEALFKGTDLMTADDRRFKAGKRYFKSLQIHLLEPIYYSPKNLFQSPIFAVHSNTF